MVTALVTGQDEIPEGESYGKGRKLNQLNTVLSRRIGGEDGQSSWLQIQGSWFDSRS
jgi:hypothetical protein